jgi:hypothetical protein
MGGTPEAWVEGKIKKVGESGSKLSVEVAKKQWHRNMPNQLGKQEIWEGEE